MPEERRQARRARVPALRVIYESASGERIEADALDISTGGVFIGAATPVPSGKRLSLEFRLASDPTRYSALGRVLWTRDTDTTAGPAGMGVKLIDADESLIALIERLVDTRERTSPGAGAAKMPARERTMLGIGLTEQAAEAPATPIIAVAPKRERTIVGVGIDSATPPAPIEPLAPVVPPAPVEPERPVPSAAPMPHALPSFEVQTPLDAPEPARAPELDMSIALDLIAKKPQEPKEAKEPREAKEEKEREEPEEQEPFSERLLVAAGVPRRRAWRWVVFLMVLVVAGGGVYLERHRIPWQRMRWYIHSKLPA